MLRRRVALPALLGVLGLVWAGVHALVHDAVARPVATGHGAAHGRTVESYFAFLPTSLALCLALALAIAAGAALGRRWTGSLGRSVWLFGIVPVLGFALDTLIELPANDPTLSGTVVVAFELVPVVLIGLLVQIPFALVAVGLASRLLWLAEGLAWTLCGPRRTAANRTPGMYSWVWNTHAPALLIAGSSRSRAPPAALIA
jgi:hypothetical protein